MKKSILYGCALAVLLLAAPAQAGFTYTGGTITTNETYDGLGADSALNPLTIGAPGNLGDDYITAGSTLTVLSGTLTINDDDFKVGNGGTAGTLILGANSTLNLNNIGQWGGGVGWFFGNTGTLIISNGATLNWQIAGTSEQRFAIGGLGTAGSVTLNGGSMRLIYGAAAVNDADAEFSIGGANPSGTGFLNLNGGTFINGLPLPFCLGCYYTTVTTTPTLAAGTTACQINILNGSFVMTEVFPTDPIYPTKASFNVGNLSYVNFDPTGSGSLSLTNWAATDYLPLVTGGQIRIAGGAASMSEFLYTSAGGQGILQLGPLILVNPSAAPTTNVFAQSPITLSVQTYGADAPSATYQWQTDGGSGGTSWSNIGGATSTNYVLDTTGLNGAYEYQIIGTSGALSVTSGVVTLNISPAQAPVFTTDGNGFDVTPAGQSIAQVGSGFTYAAYGANGTLPITFQWQKSPDGIAWTTLANQTNLTINYPVLAFTNSGYYHVIASNAIGATTNSTQVQLIVTNFNALYVWSTAVPYGGLTAEQILTNFPSTNKIAGALVAKNGGSPITVVLTNDNNEPIVFAPMGNAWAGVSGGNGFGNGANTNLTGNASFNTCLNDFYFDGAQTITLGNLIVGQKYQVQLFPLDDRAANAGRSVTYQNPADPNDVSVSIGMGANEYILGNFTASNSVESIQANFSGGGGNFNCLVLRTVGWNPPPYFTIEPASVGNVVGANAVLTGAAAGDPTIPSPAITYQWASGPAGGPYSNLSEGAKYSGTTTTSLTISNLVFADTNSAFVLIASNGGGVTTSRAASVTVVPLPPPGSFGAAVLANNPVAFWEFNETVDPTGGGNGGVLALDYSSHGNNATYGTTSQNGFNGVLSPQPPKYPGFAANQGALQMTAGTLSSAAVAPPLNLNTNNVTITMWIYPNSTVGTFTGLLMNRNGSDAAGFGFGGQTKNGMAELGYTWNQNNGNTYNFNSGLYPLSGQWSFVALVITNNSATIYLYYLDPISGNPILTSAVNNIAHTAEAFSGGTTFIGSDNAGGRVFPGVISDVAVYNSALGTQQILSLLSTGLGVAGFAPQVSGLPQGVFYPAPLPANQVVTLNATVNGTAPFTYGWTFDGVSLSDGPSSGATILGSHTTSLTISNLTMGNVGSYQLIATNSISTSSGAIVPVSVLPATLVGQWLVGSNQSMADVSGFSPPGTHDASSQQGVVTWSSDVPAAAPAGSYSLSFNTGDGLVVSNSSTLDVDYTNTFDSMLYNGMTVMCWAKGWPSGAWNPWLSKYGENGQGWQLRRNGGTNNPTWTVRGGGNEDMSAAFFSNDGNWHHYAGTYSPITSLRTLYVDGVPVQSFTSQGKITGAITSHMMIGARDSGGNSFGNLFTGEIYDVRVYNYALPKDQVAAAMTGQPDLRNYYVAAGTGTTLTTAGIHAAPPFSGYQWTFNGANLSDGPYLGGTISGSGTLNLAIANVTANNAGVYQLLVTNVSGVTTNANVKLIVEPASLVGHWLPGTQVLADTSGFQPSGTHDAAVQSGTVGWSTDVPAGASAGSYSLAFTNAGLVVSNSSTLNTLFGSAYTNTFDDTINNSMTIMCWAKGLPGAWNPWVSKFGDNGQSWQLRVNAAVTNSCFTIRSTGGTEDLTSSIGTGDGKWHHYAGTYSLQTGIRNLYVDGILAASETNQGPYILDPASRLMIGAKDSGGLNMNNNVANNFGNYLTGEIYDVRIYNYALNQNQIGTVAVTPPFFGGSPQIIPDISGLNGHAMVLTWPYGSLLSATNVTGPWTPSGFTSPYTNLLNQPRMFFRLSNP